MATTPQERRHLDRMARRRRIQRIARRAFAERGFAGATIEDIAGQAGLSVGAIYLYFKSKEELSLSLLQESLERFGDEIERVLAPPREPPQKLRALWDLLVAWNSPFLELCRILPLAGTPPTRGRPRQRVSEEVLDGLGRAAGRSLSLFAMVIAEGIEQGMYRVECRDTAPALVWAAYTGLLALHEAREALGLPGPDFASACQGCFQMLERGLRA